mmetsp:Transcript_7010/g.25857  ORF Transcript_7010/g.25857 Transcript_7010/m.25857 type:complete len:518 (+) Transcript_7010:119-1672(+)
MACLRGKAHGHSLLVFKLAAEKLQWRLLRQPRRCLVTVQSSAHKHAGTKLTTSRALSTSGVQDESSAAATPHAAYVHVPFCKRRCYYCDFPISVVGNKGAESAFVRDGMQSYTDTVLREIDATASSQEQLNGALDSELYSIFLGGGTPSLLPVDMINSIIQRLERRFDVSASAEISIEADPGTFDLSKLKAWEEIGITRLSMGVQAFDEHLLAKCGRAHTLDDVFQAIDTIKQSTVLSSNWSLDLMMGLPFQSEKQWSATLAHAVEAEPAHISLYDLQVEAGTSFGKWYTESTAPLPTEESTVSMYIAASETLQAAGYEHYEVSNYARPGHQCRHNLVYWRNQQFYAFGNGATSFIQGHRIARPRRLAAYKAWVDQLETEVDMLLHGDKSGVQQLALEYEKTGNWDGCGVHSKEQEWEKLLDTIMLSLRLGEGLDLSEMRARFGSEPVIEIVAGLEAATKGELAECFWGADGNLARVKLTTRGMLVSNSVISDVWAHLERHRAKLGYARKPGDEDVA